MRVLIDVWVSERRCPLPLADRFTEFDLPAQTACALWAATEGERDVYYPDEKEDPSPCGPFPSYCGHWYWNTLGMIEYAHGVPFLDECGCPDFAEPLAAILWLLDNFKVTP